MSYLVPSEFVTKMIDAGEAKILMSRMALADFASRDQPFTPPEPQPTARNL